MHDILVPADPADLIDRIIVLQLRIETTDDPALKSDLTGKHAVLVRLADRIMPPDDELAGWMLQLGAARRDLLSLGRDLRACDRRHDYGIAFVALSQAMLAAMQAADDARDGINDWFVRAGVSAIPADIRREPEG